MKFILILAFMVHGILYFVYPVEISDSTSYIKYIKYIILLFIIFFSIRNIDSKITFGIVATVWITFILYFIANGLNIDRLYVLYVLPIVVMYVLKSELTFNILQKASKYSYVIISLFAYLEYFIFISIFSRFSHGNFGYRGSSILVNPNNFGITIVLISIFLIENIKNRLIKNIIYINTSVLIFFSMSKTAMILFLFYIIVKNMKIYIPLLTIIVILFISYDITLDERYFQSLAHRGIYNLSFYEIASENILFPFLDTHQYTDNIYLQLWGNFGLIGLLIYIFINIGLSLVFISLKQYINVLILILFLLIGYSTNFLYIWPLSYIYWGFIFYQLSAMYKRSVKI
jgi:hypothetical protein